MRVRRSRGVFGAGCVKHSLDRGIRYRGQLGASGVGYDVSRWG